MRLGRRSRSRAASTSRGPRTSKLECLACPGPIHENPQPSGSRPLGRSCRAPHAGTIELQGLSTGDDNVGRDALHRLTEASSEAEEMQSMPRRCQEASRRPNNSPDRVKSRAGGDLSLGLARTDTDVGLERIAGARNWPPVGTRFAFLGFSHGLSLKLTRRAGPSATLESPAGIAYSVGAVARFRRAA